MPRGHAAKREAKKHKKKAKKLAPPSAVYAEQEVEVVRRKRKPRDEEEI